MNDIRVGDICKCGAGRLGIITQEGLQDTIYGPSYVGYHIWPLDFFGKPWSSKIPQLIYRQGDEYRMADNNLTLINVVLDRSGSMVSIRDDMIGGFNEFIKNQRDSLESNEDILVNLFRFDNEFETVFRDRNIRRERVELNDRNFVPRGGTALLDAMGRAINDVSNEVNHMPRYLRPSKVIFVIITDGFENCSKEYTKNQLFNLIKDKETHDDWQFVFLGANQDAISTGAGFGLTVDKSYTYQADRVGVTKMFNALSNSTVDYRKGVVNSVAFKNEDR